MSTEFEYLRKGLGIAPDRALNPETDLLELGQTPEKIIKFLDAEFPLLMGVDNSDPKSRAALFRHGMDHSDLGVRRSSDHASDIEFGRAWTMQRLAGVFQKCAESSYPDNGSD